ncbi:MAG: septum formation initiator family protein [Candidatus Auribacterota bacterium]|nr:septum formation initiator family protein [Candidatus Auribacterota bacterium]
MNKKGLSLSLKSVLISLLIIGIVIGSIVLLIPRWVAKSKLSKKQKELKEKIVKGEEKYLRLKEELDALENDPVYLEKIARDDLGMKRSGEVIYKFEDD